MLIFLQEQSIEKGSQRKQNEPDLLIVFSQRAFCSLGGMLVSKVYLTSKLPEYLQRFHAESNEFS